MNLQDKLDHMQKVDEQNWELSCFFDSGYKIRIGDPHNGFTAEFEANTLDEIRDWLQKVKP